MVQDLYIRISSFRNGDCQVILQRLMHMHATIKASFLVSFKAPFHFVFQLFCDKRYLVTSPYFSSG